MQNQKIYSKFSSYISRRNILIGIGVAIVALLLWFSARVAYLKIQDNNFNSQKNKYTSIPPTAPYVPDELVIKFREGSIPLDLQKEIENNKRISKNPVGFISVNFNSTARSIAKVKSPEEKLKNIDTQLHKSGVVKYKKLFKSDSSDLKGYYTIYLGKSANILKVEEELGQLDYLTSSEPRFIMNIASVPNDPSYSQQWGLEKIGMPKAWDLTTGSKSVTVAVIDSGADLAHPDLVDNLIPGHNFVTEGASPADDNGHGTHVSGIIGAVGNNGIGVSGVNWKVKIMPVKVMDSQGSGDTGIIAQGVEYAADNGAKVLNMSLGGSRPSPCGGFYQSAIDHANSKGALIVVAAGNQPPDDASQYTMANCNGVFTVGATTPSDARASFSKWGSSVHIAAPGLSIYSTWPGGSYQNDSGTSMATPFVTGAAALLLSVNPSLDANQVKDCLVNNGDPISTDKPIGPRLNMLKTLENCSSAKPISPTAAPSGAPTPTGAAPTPDISTWSLKASPYCDGLKSQIKVEYTVPAGHRGLIEVMNSTGKNACGGNALDDWSCAEFIGGSCANLKGAGSYIVTGNQIQSCPPPKNELVVGSEYTIEMHSGDEAVGPEGGSKMVSTKFTPVSCPLSSTPTPSTAPTTTPPDDGEVIPTPVTYYSCHYDPICSSGNPKAIQICPLVCDPAP